jgi:HEAT repeat protein
MGMESVSPVIVSATRSRRRKMADVYHLIGHLKSGHTRLAAASALGRMGAEAKAAVPALIELLTDCDPAVRQIAIWALNEIGDQANLVVPALIEMFRGDEWHKEAAATTLGAIGPEAGAAVPALASALNDNSSRVRACSAIALARIGGEAISAIPALTRLCHENIPWDRLFALVALEALTKQNSRVEQSANAEGAYDAASQQRRVDAKDDVPDLIASLADHREQIRHAAIMALAAIEDKSDLVVSALVSMLKSDAESMREEAACALGLIGPAAESAIPHLIYTLNDRDSRVRASSAAALARVGSTAKSVVDALTGVSLGCVPWDRLFALVALEALSVVEKVNR